jgi:aldehyde:ferredoxin oxidoreductase
MVEERERDGCCLLEVDEEGAAMEQVGPKYIKKTRLFTRVRPKLINSDTKSCSECCIRCARSVWLVGAQMSNEIKTYDMVHPFRIFI